MMRKNRIIEIYGIISAFIKAEKKPPLMGRSAFSIFQQNLRKFLGADYFLLFR
jgi:hypothetical protein